MSSVEPVSGRRVVEGALEPGEAEEILFGRKAFFVEVYHPRCGSEAVSVVDFDRGFSKAPRKCPRCGVEVDICEDLRYELLIRSSDSGGSDAPGR